MEAPQIEASGAMVFDTPESINAFRLLTLKSALKLEIVGLKRHGVPASQIVRDIMGVKTRNKEQLFGEYVAYLKAEGVLFD